MSLYLGNTPIANTGYNKANTDLSNLTSTGKNIANWSNNVTNCITEIPQDINLELNNGTLTLKAGSKVYVPNGFNDTTPKFDVITIESDLTRSDTTLHTKDPCFYILEENRILPYLGFSGATAPTFTGQGIWYDTTNNLCKRSVNGGSTWDTVHVSLPCALVTNEGTGYSSIDQVFNGFGYIGSTVFALPGIKGLIPNGRNADSSLKNIEFETSKVIVRNDMGNNVSYDTALNINGYFNYGLYSLGNDNYLSSGYGSQLEEFVCGKFSTDSTGRITSFTPKTIFHALDYNDSSTISGWSMPSSRYIDLTIGAHGATYTAPANGWFTIIGYAGAGAFLWIKNNSNQIMQSGATYSASAKGGVCIPCKKGDSVQVGYYGGALDYVRFIYAEGENV